MTSDTRLTELDPSVLQYYEKGEEDSRLRASVGRLELWRTQHILRRVLPAAPSVVLDIGGGPGVHAEWLAESGYAAHVIDPVPLHVSQAGQLDGVTSSLGDARELSAADASVDAALLLGPLYHLVVRAERLTALTEAMRVTRSEGIVAAAAISRFASLRVSLREGWLDDSDWLETVERAVHTGQHINADGRERRFTTAYFHRPDDLHNEMSEAGLRDVEVYAVEGPGSFLHNLDELLDSPQHWEVLSRWIELVEKEPTLIGASSHILAVGRVP